MLLYLYEVTLFKSGAVGSESSHSPQHPTASDVVEVEAGELTENRELEIGS